jgi:molybdopterin-guanine dinucleotide biosynthesis protein
MGDTGAGKTTLIMQILRQIQGRGHAAIVYDPAHTASGWRGASRRRLSHRRWRVAGTLAV